MLITHYNETYEFVVQSLNSDLSDDTVVGHFIKFSKTIPGIVVAIYNVYTVYKLINKCYDNYRNKRKFSKLFHYNEKNKKK